MDKNDFVYEESNGKYRLNILVGSLRVKTVIKDWCSEKEMEEFLYSLALNFNIFTIDCHEKKNQHAN